MLTFFSLRIKLERHSACSLVLGWAVFSSWETFLVLLLPWCFPFISLSLSFEGCFPFSILQISYLCIYFLCLHVWFHVSCYPRHHCFLCSVVSVIPTTTSRIFQFFCSFHHGITAFFVCFFWCFLSFVSFKVVIIQFILCVLEVFQIPSFKKPELTFV